MPDVVLYTREGCCLCQEALEVLERLHRRHPESFRLLARDIDADDDLLRRYLERIPVVEIDGVEVFELFIDEPELEQRLGIVGSR